MEYIEAVHDDDETCFLCDKPKDSDREVALVLTVSGWSSVILNAYPYNPGHLLVSPLRHVAGLEELTTEESADLSAMLARCVAALQEAAQPQGFNVGMNLGRVAGAGVPGHLHWHVVPRWNGDTNFMPVFGETRVLPELLAETYAKLRPFVDR
jgi:ATP adenylyltransferase